MWSTSRTTPAALDREGDRAAELVEKTGYTRPHTVHCMPGDNVISMLGDPDGAGSGGFAVLDARSFEVKGRWENGGPALHRLRLLVPAAQEHAGLLGVQRAERLRVELRHRGRRRGPVRAAAASSGTSPSGGSSRPWTSAKPAWSARAALAARPRGRPGLSARRWPATSSATARTEASRPSP